MSRAQKEAVRKFPPGSKVRLCVGGPVMAVAGVAGSGRVVCQWFDGDCLQQAKFAPETLTPAEPVPPKSAQPLARRAATRKVVKAAVKVNGDAPAGPGHAGRR